jgi:hypothetical protein
MPMPEMFLNYLFGYLAVQRAGCNARFALHVHLHRRLQAHLQVQVRLDTDTDTASVSSSSSRMRYFNNAMCNVNLPT